MNLAICFTSNWIEYALTCIYSYVKYNDVANIYIFSDSDFQIKGLNCNVEYYSFDCLNELSDLNISNQYGRAALMKLFIHNYICEDKVLLVDCDTICTGSLSDLYFLDLSDFSAAMCLEKESGVYSGYSKEGEVLEKYGSTGVVLLNLNYIRNSNLDREVIRLLNSYSYFLPDQDVFNILFRNWLTISNRYNYRFDNSVSNPIIYHWAGFRKDPWIYNSSFGFLWSQYEDECNLFV